MGMAELGFIQTQGSVGLQSLGASLSKFAAPSILEARLGFLCNSIKFSLGHIWEQLLCARPCAGPWGSEMMSQTAPYPEEELTVWWERQTSKQIMQYSVTCAGKEVHQAAERRRGLTGVGGGSCHPLHIPLRGGDPLVFGIPQGCGDRTFVLTEAGLGMGAWGPPFSPLAPHPAIPWQQ